LGNVVFFKRKKKTTPHRRRITDTTWIPALALLIAATAMYALGFGPPRVDAAVIGHAAFERCLGGSQKTCIVDGDTIRFEGTRIRLEDIDAPEVFSPKCESEKALGQRATQRLLEWMNAGPFDVVYTGGRDADIYGRKLRVIERNGRSAGDMLVTEGLARRWDGARRSWCG
jgi:micrococcal nuclease